jgi:hypothetical protein
LKVIAPFYGTTPRPIEAVRHSCPVVGSYPENDFTAGMGRKLAEVLDTYKIDHDIKVYPEPGIPSSTISGLQTTMPQPRPMRGKGP